MCINYIDLPPVPEELLESYDDIISKPELPIGNYQGKIIPMVTIRRKEVNPELVNWLQDNCTFPVSSQYLLLNSLSPVHRDPPNRPQAYNYIIHAGGTEVTTTVYNNDYSILKSMIIPERQWHCLDTGKLHGVKGILKNRWRILLSINYTAGALTQNRTAITDIPSQCSTIKL